MCGDHRACMHPRYPGRGSSPHVRGPQEQVDDASRQLGIIPACAGTTCAPSARTGSTGDHPRMCGDHVSTSWSPVMPEGSSPHAWGHGMTAKEVLKNVGSSPHAWGPRDVPHAFRPSAGIIPTRVGTTSRTPEGTRRPVDHPHTRGDHMDFSGLRGVSRGSSPHACEPPRARG